MTVHNTRNVRIRIDHIVELLMSARNLIGSVDRQSGRFEETSTLGLSDLQDIKDEVDALIDEWKYGIVRDTPKHMRTHEG